MKAGIKKQIELVTDYYYHRRHKKMALKALKNIEKEQGKTNRHYIKQSNEYAREVLGWKGYAPWLYVYSAIANEFKEGWIPDNYYGRIVVPKLKGEYGNISYNKSITEQLLQSDAFPDLFYYANGLWFDTNYNIVDIKSIKDTLRTDKFVFKRDSSARGEGVLVLTPDKVKIEALEKAGNGVIQKHIKQHEFFNEIIDQSVATLRLTTFINEFGNVDLVAAYLRVGSQDDAIVKSSSHIRIPVELKNGILNKTGYTINWTTIDKHPHTGFVFEGKELPQYEECIKTVISLHKKLPYVRIIGWDVVVDVDSKVKIMEWNGGHNDIKFSEATQGPIFKGYGLENLWKD